MNSDRTFSRSYAEMDSASIVAIVGGVVAVVTVFITGLWQWVTGRKKTELDAQGALMSGFIALIAEFKTERETLINRINALERNNQQQDRHIARIERLMSKHNIALPKDVP